MKNLNYPTFLLQSIAFVRFAFYKPLSFAPSIFFYGECLQTAKLAQIKGGTLIISKNILY
jgi:hypothetical protein